MFCYFPPLCFIIYKSSGKFYLTAKSVRLGRFWPFLWLLGLTSRAMHCGLGGFQIWRKSSVYTDNYLHELAHQFISFAQSQKVVHLVSKWLNYTGKLWTSPAKFADTHYPAKISTPFLSRHRANGRCYIPPSFSSLSNALVLPKQLRSGHIWCLFLRLVVLHSNTSSDFVYYVIKTCEAGKTEVQIHTNWESLIGYEAAEL